MPPSGTFILRPTALVSGGSPIIDGNGAIPNDYAGWLVNNYPVSTILSCMQDQVEVDFCQADVFDNGAAPALNDTIRFSFAGLSYYLDGSLIPIQFSSLPTGFTPTAVTVKVDQTFAPDANSTFNLQGINFVDGTDNTLSFDITPVPNSLSLFNNGCGIKVSVPGTPLGGFAGTFNNLRIEGTYNTVSVDSAFPPQGGIFGKELITIHGNGFIDAGTVTNVFFGGLPATDIFVISNTVLSCFNPAHSAASVVVGVEIDSANVANSATSIFEYQQFSFTLQDALTPVYPGDKVVINHINNPNSPGGSLTGVTQIILSYTDPLLGPKTIIIVIDPQNPGIIFDGVFIYWINFVFIQEEFTLWFYLPPFFKRYVGPIDVAILGTTFSGTVALGTLNVLYADGSGIYFLDQNQTNDKLYFRSGYTTDIKRIMLSLEDEIFDENDSFYSMLTYPRKILALTEYEDDEQDDLMVIGVLRVVVITRNVEIPSPFVSTSFLP